MDFKIKKLNEGCFFVLFLFCCFAVIFVFKLYTTFCTQEDVTAHIIRAERVTYKHNGIYLVFTEKETFCIKDNWFLFRFNSSDDYGKIEAKKEYKFTVYGFRVPFLSWYRNIIKIKEKTDEK